MLTLKEYDVWKQRGRYNVYWDILAWISFTRILKNRSIDFIIFDWQTKEHINIKNTLYNTDFISENSFASSLFYSTSKDVAIWPILCKWTVSELVTKIHGSTKMCPILLSTGCLSLSMNDRSFLLLTIFLKIEQVKAGSKR